MAVEIPPAVLPAVPEAVAAVAMVPLNKSPMDRVFTKTVQRPGARGSQGLFPWQGAQRRRGAVLVETLRGAAMRAGLPTADAGLSYDGLETVAHGQDAQAAYLEPMASGIPDERKAELERGLLGYCRRDTLALQKLARLLSTDRSCRMKPKDMAKLAALVLPLAKLNRQAMYAKGDIKGAAECENDIYMLEEAIRRAGKGTRSNRKAKK